MAFPGEKVPGPARESLAAANLATTRLSLADAASDIRRISLLCWADSIWACDRVRVEREGSLHREERLHAAPKFFLHRAKEYWSVAFFSRLGLMAQSDLKSCFKQMRDALATFDVATGIDWESYHRAKKHMLSALRSAFRLVATRLEWERILKARGEAGASESRPVEPPQSGVHLGDEGALTLESLLLQLRSLSELALVLACKSIAELQELTCELRTRCDEALQLFSQEQDGSESRVTRALVSETSNRVQLEVQWLSSWAKMTMEWREACGLKSLAEIAMDPGAATEYFERVLDLKRQHYQVFDLRETLRPNDYRIDFWIGGVAAGVAALFAFVATIVLTWWLQGRMNVDMSTTSLIAVSIFAGVNVVVYVLKDRMKEWLKTNAKRYLRVTTGRWDGFCTFRIPGPVPGTVVDKRVAEVQRRTWWTRTRDKWHFHLWERYRILPEAATLQAGIVKQTWRLPLDEILDTLDDSRHVILVPTTEGIPQEIPVLKRVVFPFRTAISVHGNRNRTAEVLDQARLAGIVVASGGRIVGVE